MSSRGKQKKIRAAQRKHEAIKNRMPHCSKCGRLVEFRTVEVSEGKFSHEQVPCKFGCVV